MKWRDYNRNEDTLKVFFKISPSDFAENPVYKKFRNKQKFWRNRYDQLNAQFEKIPAEERSRIPKNLHYSYGHHYLSNVLKELNPFVYTFKNHPHLTYDEKMNKFAKKYNPNQHNPDLLRRRSKSANF